MTAILYLLRSIWGLLKSHSCEEYISRHGESVKKSCVNRLTTILYILSRDVVKDLQSTTRSTEIKRRLMIHLVPLLFL
jgi:hypothetical protein